MARKKKRVRLKIKNIFMLLLGVCFVVLMCYCAIEMPINNIYISGNDIVSDNEIMELVNIDDYPSFILANRFEMKRLLFSNEYIENVKIKKKFGNIIEFVIEEYIIVASNKENKIILSNGVVLDNKYGIYDVPLLINEISDKEIYNSFVSKVKKIDSNIYRQISEIEYSPVEVDDERFLFYMNDGNLVHVTLTKLNKINKYNNIKDKLEGKKGIIYLDSGDYVELVK